MDLWYRYREDRGLSRKKADEGDRERGENERGLTVEGGRRRRKYFSASVVSGRKRVSVRLTRWTQG